MTGSEETEFKRITRAFFEREWKEGFDIFYKDPADEGKQIYQVR